MLTAPKHALTLTFRLAMRLGAIMKLPRPNPIQGALFAALVCSLGSAVAQEGTEPETQTAVAGGAAFELAQFGIAEFEEPQDLYGKLTERGRCPVKVMAPERQPCAFIFYERVSGEGKQVNFKPVFKVESEETIWVIHDSRLKRVAIPNLYSDEVTLRGQTAKYRSFGVVGNEENASNCVESRPCLSALVKENMFLMYRSIPDLVVEMLWHGRKLQNGTSVITRQ